MLRAAIERGVRENDLLIVSAGSSAGRRDFTARIIDDLGEVLVHGIAMKPGTPSILGRIDDKPVIGVPGYPIAAMTAVRELAFPLLAEWGFRTRSPETLRARLVGRVTSDPGYDEFLLLAISRAGNRYIATPLPRKSHTQMVMVRGNAYLHIPAGVGCIEEETEVEVTLTGPCWTIREARSPPT
nr:molybdopterin-binding protein [Methanoculleus sp. DTU007]